MTTRKENDAGKERLKDSAVTVGELVGLLSILPFDGDVTVKFEQEIK